MILVKTKSIPFVEIAIELRKFIIYCYTQSTLSQQGIV